MPGFITSSGVGVLVDSVLGAAHLRRLSQSLASPRVVSAAHQFIFFEQDPVVPSAFIKGIGNDLQNAGSRVQYASFPERDHVRILKRHPEEATRILQTFVRSL